MHRADDDEERQSSQLDDHHDVVRAGAFLRAAEEQPGDEHDDRERGNVDEYRDAADTRRGVEQPTDCGIGAQRRGAVPVVNHCGTSMPIPRMSVLK